MCCEQLFGYDVDDVFSYQTGAQHAAMGARAWHAPADTELAQPSSSASVTAAWASCGLSSSPSSSSTL